MSSCNALGVVGSDFLIVVVLAFLQPVAGVVSDDPVPPVGMECASKIFPFLRRQAKDTKNCGAFWINCASSAAANEADSTMNLTELRCVSSIQENKNKGKRNLFESLMKACTQEASVSEPSPDVANEAGDPFVAEQQSGLTPDFNVDEAVKTVQTQQKNAVTILNMLCSMKRGVPYVQGPEPLLAEFQRKLEDWSPRLDPDKAGMARDLAAMAKTYMFNGFCPKKFIVECPGRQSADTARLICKHQDAPKRTVTQLVYLYKFKNPLTDLDKAKEMMMQMFCNCKAIDDNRKKKHTRKTSGSGYTKEELSTTLVTDLSSCEIKYPSS